MLNKTLKLCNYSYNACNNVFLKLPLCFKIKTILNESIFVFYTFTKKNNSQSFNYKTN